MRTLDKNKITMWVVKPIDRIENIDEHGYYNGDFTIIYSEPVKIRIPLYPSNGDIVNKIFGKDIECDMISVSNDVQLDEFSLLFLSEPISNFGNTYDYSISKIAKSINTYSYGFVRRK